MSKTVSARLPESKHDELRERCNKLGCTMNDFVEASIDFILTGSTGFDFGDQIEEPEQRLSQESKSPELSTKEIPIATVYKVSWDDGKTWYDKDGNRLDSLK